MSPQDVVPYEPKAPEPTNGKSNGNGSAEEKKRAQYAKFDLNDHRQRQQNAWRDKGYWESLYNDAYDYAIPYRQPAKRKGKGANRIDMLFDDTAINSTFHGAGTLKEDLFPTGTPWFKFAPGPLSQLMARQDGENGQKFAQQLEAISDQIAPYFQTGEFDQSANEMCIDLYAGTGAMLLIEGNKFNPLRFVTIPCDELAIEAGAYGDVAAAFWNTDLTRRQIYKTFPKGIYPQNWGEDMKQGANNVVTLHQDFYADGPDDGSGWNMCVWLDGCDTPIVMQKYRTQPLVVARYHRVPGEQYGRGPIMLTMPAIKTANKAQELTLKAFAINMLGIWGYRPGGAFNPDTARLAPGQFWPMNATGGVLGADVTRLDQSTGKVDMAQLVTSNLTDRIKIGLNDDRVESPGKTPISASQYVGETQKLRVNYIGAFGRLVHEIVPVMVRRAVEVLYNQHLLNTDLKPDPLFVQAKVTSPLAEAMKIDHLKPIMTYLSVLEGFQQNPARFLDVDQALDDIGSDLNIPAKWRVSVAQRQVVDKATAQANAENTITQSLAAKPELVANALAPPSKGIPAA